MKIPTEQLVKISGRWKIREVGNPKYPGLIVSFPRERGFDQGDQGAWYVIPGNEKILVFVRDGVDPKEM